MKNALIFSTKKLFPPEDGRANVINNLCTIFTDLGYDVEVLSFVNQTKNTKYKIVNVSSVFNITWFIGLFQCIPLQVLFFRKFKKSISNIDKKYDVVIADMARTAELALLIPSKLHILDLDDLLSIRYYRQIKEVNYSLGKAKFFIKSKYFLWLIEVIIKKISKFVLKYEAYTMQKYEQKIVAQFDRTLFISKKEMKDFIFQNTYTLGNLFAIPNYISSSKNYIRKEMFQFDIVFTGNMDTAHNQASANFIISKILPLLLVKHPYIRLLFAGYNSSRLLYDLSYSKNITCWDNLPDLEIAYSSSQIFLCPIVFGSGIKTKLLEAFSYSIPVVCNELALEGIDPKTPICFIAQNEYEYVEKISLILDNIIDYSSIVQNAFKLIVNEFSYDAVKEKWEKLLN